MSRLLSALRKLDTKTEAVVPALSDSPVASPQSSRHTPCAVAELPNPVDPPIAQPPSVEPVPIVAEPPPVGPPVSSPIAAADLPADPHDELHDGGSSILEPDDGLGWELLDWPQVPADTEAAALPEETDAEWRARIEADAPADVNLSDTSALGWTIRFRDLLDDPTDEQPIPAAAVSSNNGPLANESFARQQSAFGQAVTEEEARALVAEFVGNEAVSVITAPQASPSRVAVVDNRPSRPVKAAAPVDIAPISAAATIDVVLPEPARLESAGLTVSFVPLPLDDLDDNAPTSRHIPVGDLAALFADRSPSVGGRALMLVPAAPGLDLAPLARALFDALRPSTRRPIIRLETDQFPSAGQSPEAHLAGLKEMADFVLITAATPDALTLARWSAHCDAIYLILPSNDAPQAAVQRLVARWPYLENRLHGCIIV